MVPFFIAYKSLLAKEPSKIGNISLYNSTAVVVLPHPFHPIVMTNIYILECGHIRAWNQLKHNDFSHIYLMTIKN